MWGGEGSHGSAQPAVVQAQPVVVRAQPAVVPESRPVVPESRSVVISEGRVAPESQSESQPVVPESQPEPYFSGFEVVDPVMVEEAVVVEVRVGPIH